MFGGDPRAGGFRLRDERLEACLFGLRFELPGRRLAPGMMLAGERRGLQVSGDGLLELIARRPLAFLVAHALRLSALYRALEQTRLRLVAEVQKQRIDSIRVVVERHALNEHWPGFFTRIHEMALERGGAVRPAAGGEFLPAGAFGLDDATSEVGVEDGAQRAGGKEAERGIVAGEQGAVEAYPYQAGRLPVEEPAQERRVSQDCALLPSRAGT